MSAFGLKRTLVSDHAPLPSAGLAYVFCSGQLSFPESPRLGDCPIRRPLFAAARLSPAVWPMASQNNFLTQNRKRSLRKTPLSVRDILKLTANPRANFVPKIMIRCPITGKSVPTGLTTETIVFDSIAGDLKITMSCPACRKVHEWRPKDAWIDKGKSGSHT